MDDLNVVPPTVTINTSELRGFTFDVTGYFTRITALTWAARRTAEPGLDNAEYANVIALVELAEREAQSGAEITQQWYARAMGTDLGGAR
jgi:hypothetical protein